MARRKPKSKMDNNGTFYVVMEGEDEYWEEDSDDYEMRKQIQYEAGPFIDMDTAVGWVRSRGESGKLSFEDGTWCVVEKMFEFKVKQTVEEVVVRKTKAS